MLKRIKVQIAFVKVHPVNVEFSALFQLIEYFSFQIQEHLLRKYYYGAILFLKINDMMYKYS